MDDVKQQGELFFMDWSGCCVRGGCSWRYLLKVCLMLV